LHDGAQQRLVAVSMHLNLARTRSDIATAKVLSAAEHHVRHALAALRDLAHDSFATVLSTEGLTAAIEDLAASSPLQVTIQVALSEHPVPRDVQMAAYVAVQEGLANVVNHSETDRAWVTLVEESGVLTVRVVDSGDGVARTSERFSAAADRVGAVGGSFHISSKPGQGTTLTARMPCAS
ncbi:MAG: histidine kinase, partial [Actinomycetota bacterium]|nr:histidine kinase [Actinomycetota bacterium]